MDIVGTHTECLHSPKIWAGIENPWTGGKSHLEKRSICCWDRDFWNLEILSSVNLHTLTRRSLQNWTMCAGVLTADHMLFLSLSSLDLWVELWTWIRILQWAFPVPWPMSGIFGRIPTLLEVSELLFSSFSPSPSTLLSQISFYSNGKAMESGGRCSPYEQEALT